ncbi:MAG TPA: hypothetical protein VGO60_17645 [Iamia sp.]|jgi:hypothetical protein|nr:hypothetical protein [Iamia sp.]
MTDPTTSGGPAGLADRVNQIHVPEPNADRERMMLIGGGVLVGLGIIAVLVGYVGASGTSNVYEQVPYALSGGVLGLALIIIGCALVIRFSLARLFRFWLARIVHEHQVQTDRTVDALGRIETLLAGGSVPAAPPAAPAVDVTASSDGSESGDAHRVRREPLRAEPLEK